MVETPAISPPPHSINIETSRINVIIKIESRKVVSREASPRENNKPFEVVIAVVAEGIPS